MVMRIMKTPTEMGKSIAIEWEGEVLLLGWVVSVVVGLVVDVVLGWAVDVVGSSIFRLFQHDTAAIKKVVCDNALRGM